MKRVLKKSISIFLIVVMCLTMAPLQGLADLNLPNWFDYKANASLLQDLGFYEEDYIAGIILNTNSASCAMSADGKSVASMTLDYYTQPQNISLSKCFTNALENDSTFMSSVAAWEVLTFSPTDIYSETMTKQGYYQTILFDILEVAVDYNIIPAIVKNLNKHVISTLKEINNLEIKVDDIVVNGETSWDLLNSEQQYQIIQTTAGRMTQLEMRNQTLSDFNKLVKTCTTVTDFVEKAAQLTALTTLTEDVKAVIEELYSNSSFIDNMELKASLLELKTAMNSTIDNIGTIGLELLGSAGKLSMDVFLGQMWAECVTALLGSLGAGMLIGQVIGRGLSNILFSTDKVIEKFYTMQALSDFESLMCRTVKSLGQKYIFGQNTTNASNFLKSVDLLYNTYKLDFEYSAEYADIIYTKGLINKVNLFVSGKPDSLEKINSIVNSANASLNQSLGMLTDMDNYCWYLETDHPDVFDIYYNGMSDEDIMNKYVDEVRQLTVACPTDVDIFDSEGNLSVSIKNNCVELCLPGYICIVEDDVKYILLNAGSQSVISITGTATGTMTYTICEGNKTGFNRTMRFKDVELTDGCVYEAVLPEETRLSSDEYVLVSDTGTTIKPSYDTQPDFESEVTDVIVAEELFDGFPKEVIDLVAETMFNMKSVVDLSSYDISTDDAVALFSAVAKYYPVEYSLITGGDFTYKIVVSPSMDRIMKIRFYYGDDANLSTYQKRVNDLNAEIDTLVAKIEGMDDFEKALYIHDYIVLNSEYDLELLEYMEKNNFILPGELRSEKYTEYSILVNGTGVCGSYALAYRAILNAAGMECLYLSSSQMNHAWNLVKIDGKWYHVDCCWDDPTPDTYGRARRTYFLRTDDEIMNLNHYSWTPGQYKANSEKYSNMPRNYDIKQKYDDGKWYYLTGSTLYSSDEYGKNETEITYISASSIDADNGNVYYSNGRYIYEYDIEMDERNVVYMLSNKDSGENLSTAYLSNIYVEDGNIEFYKSISKDNKQITVFDTDSLQKEKFTAITDLEISQTEVFLDVFETLQLSADIVTTGSTEDLEIEWSSSDETIVFVDEKGNITAANIGIATITATFLEYAVSCEVTVSGDGLSGMCGDNIRWEFSPSIGSLSILGKGAMPDYVYSRDVPWLLLNKKIMSVCVNEGITHIGDNAFSSCEELTTVTLSKTIKSIGSAFDYCYKISSVYVPDIKSWLKIDFKSYYSNPCKNGALLYFGSEFTSKIIIPNDLNTIGDFAFYGCNWISEIEIPISITNIGRNAFWGCSGLESISIPNNVISIGREAFYNCKKLKSITIPASVSDMIYESYYSSCPHFYGCDSLESIIVDKNNTQLSSVDGVLFNKDQTKLLIYPSKKQATSYRIPDTVDEISPGAFENSVNLKEIIIGNKVELIYFGAFSGCSNLENVIIPESVRMIDGGVFDGCVNLKSFVVDENNRNYTTDETGALYDKEKRRLIKFPVGRAEKVYTIADTVYMVDSRAFYGASSLCNVIIGSTDHEISVDLTGCESLNKICVMNPNAYITGVKTIYGPSNSKVEEYTKEKGIKFIAIDSQPHTHDYFLIDYVEPTEENDGYEYYECYCGESSSTVTLHNYGEEVTTTPTCVLDGGKSQTCLNCGEVEVIETMPATGKHSYELVSTTPGDCFNAPVSHYICSVCGDTYDKTGKIDEGHSYKDIVVQPTCTEKGYTKSVCDVCGETVISDFVSPLGHNMEITHSGTYCSAHDTLEYKCKRCDYTESVAANSSKLETKTVVVEPTCTKSGSESEVCVLCGATVSTQILNPLSHSYSDDWTIDKTATCTETGVKSKHCTRCDAKREVTEIPAAGHRYEDTVTVPTCTANGFTTHTCMVCGESYVDSIVPAKGHSYQAITNKPTCENDGSVVEVCSICGDTGTVEVLKATGHIDSDSDGKCDSCGKQLDASKNCSCLCHKSGFMGFIYKIVRIFWKLFRINKTCSCGAVHY